MVEHVISLLRERLYRRDLLAWPLSPCWHSEKPTEDTSAWARVLDVAVATGGLWAASLLADWVAHLGVYRRAPRGRTAARMFQTSGQILEAAFLPLMVLVGAGVGLLSTYTAVWIAIWVLVAELGVIAFLAVRSSQLPWWQQLLTSRSWVGLGVLVVGIKTLAH